jgi:ATP:ADP antiporter, AAA family
LREIIRRCGVAFEFDNRPNFAIAFPMAESSAIAGKKGPVDRLLSLFSDVRAGEGFPALLLTINLFLLLTGYLIIKTVREALILSEGGAVVKSYAAAAQALLLLVLVPLYGYVASQLPRIKLINGVTFFFVSNLIAFYLLGQWHVRLGVPFLGWNF